MFVSLYYQPSPHTHYTESLLLSVVPFFNKDVFLTDNYHKKDILTVCCGFSFINRYLLELISLILPFPCTMLILEGQYIKSCHIFQNYV